MSLRFFYPMFFFIQVYMRLFYLQSCPVINVYTAENIDTALDAATRSFCSQEVSMFTEVDQIWLSQIFQWYSVDFGNTDVDVIKYVYQSP